MLLHLLNDCSTKSYRIEWFCFEWLDPVVPESWPDSFSKSSPVPVEWYPQLPHQSGDLDIFWVGRRGIHCEHPLALKVAPLDMQETHTSQGSDMGQCSEVLAFLWCQRDIHLLLEKPVGIHDHGPQTPMDSITCQCSFVDGIGQPTSSHEFVSPSLLRPKITLSLDSDQLSGVQ
jgi:hypothetical protein